MGYTITARETGEESLIPPAGAAANAASAVAGREGGPLALGLAVPHLDRVAFGDTWPVTNPGTAEASARIERVMSHNWIEPNRR
jgi:hypothetical protein